MERRGGRMIGGLAARLERWWQRLLAAQVRRELGYCHPGAWIEMPVKLRNPRGVKLHDGVCLSWNGSLTVVDRHGETGFAEPEIVIRERTYVGAGYHIAACHRVEIGADCMLADRVYISDNVHHFEDVTRSIHDCGLKVGRVVIGDGTWIGENACVFGDLTIGRRCVIGANSVVTKSLPDHSVAVGAPARIVKRYDPVGGCWRKTDAAGGWLDETGAGRAR